MAFNDLEQKRVEEEVSAFVESRRPPPHIRSELDLGFRVSGQSIEIFSIRPAFRQPDKTTEIPIAKATYIRKRDYWKVYWQRADLKWHYYGPCPVVKDVHEFLDLVGKDEYCCFFG